MALRFDEEEAERKLSKELSDWANSRFEHNPPYKTRHLIAAAVTVERPNPPEGDEVDDYPEYDTYAKLYIGRRAPRGEPGPVLRQVVLGSAQGTASEPEISTAMYTEIEEEVLAHREWVLKPLQLRTRS